MLGTGKNTFVKKHHAKRLKVCHKCARWTCNAECHSLEMAQFIKDDPSKESLDNLLLTFEMHTSEDVHRVIHDLWPHFHKEYARHSLGNLTKKTMFVSF